MTDLIRKTKKIDLSDIPYFLSLYFHISSFLCDFVFHYFLGMFLLVSFCLSRSENECLTYDAESSKPWTTYNVETVNQSLIFGVDSSAEYNTNRNRKKWSLTFCGNITSSTFAFLTDETKDYLEQYYLDIEMVPENTKLKYSLYKNGKISAQKLAYIHGYDFEKQEYCFTVIHGRGYLGIFSLPHVENKEPIFLVPYVIPREHKLQYISHANSTVSKLCIGDFFGEERVNVDYETEWKSNMNDFL